MAAFPLAVGITTLILSLFMVESPYYLVSKGRNEEAEEPNVKAGGVELAAAVVERLENGNVLEIRKYE